MQKRFVGNRIHGEDDEFRAGTGTLQSDHPAGGTPELFPDGGDAAGTNFPQARRTRDHLPAGETHGDFH